MVKLLVMVMAAVACHAQTLNLTSPDSRCSAGSRGPNPALGRGLTCTFTNRETMPMDYGIAVMASGSGTWTLGAQIPNTCSYRLFNVYDRTGMPVTTITPPMTFYLQPLYADVMNCAAGAYIHDLPFTNGAATVNLTAVQVIRYRRAAPIYFNGFNVADSALTAHGWAQGPVGGALFSYNLNFQSCSNCNPGQNPADMPPPAGSSFTDELGNSLTVCTPPSYTHQNSEKAAMNLDNSYVLVSDPFGNYSIWDCVHGSAQWPSLNVNRDFGGQGAHCWSSTSAKDLYSIITDGAFKSPQTGTFKHMTLGNPSSYKMHTGSGEPPGTMWVFPASLGRVLSTTISHGDCDSANRMPLATIKEFQATVNVTGATVTATSGDAFDNHLLDQTVLGKVVTAVNSPSQLTLSEPPGDRTGAAIRVTTLWNLCVVDLPAAEAGGASYTPVCADLSTLPRPLVNYASNPGTFLSKGVDSVSGLSYIYLGNFPYDVVGSYRPGVDRALTLHRSFLAPGDPYGKTCDQSAATNNPRGSTPNRCLAGSHGDTFQTADGSQWLAVIPDGASWEVLRLRDIATGEPRVLEAGGSYSVAQFTNYVGGEAGGARLAPYWAISTDGDALAGSATSQAVTTCTNTSPAILQLAQVPDFGRGAGILVNGVQGNRACNGVRTAISINGNNVTLDVNGNGRPVPNTGAVTKNTTFAANNRPDADQAILFRDLGIEGRRVGHLRSVPYPNDHFASGFWAQPRMAPCMDGSCAIFTTNFGLPDSYQVVKVTFPKAGGALQTNQFDRTHSVKASRIAETSITLDYSTPDKGDAIVEIGQSQRLTDGIVAADPSGKCMTVGWAVLSQSSSSVFTCGVAHTWAHLAPDSSYRVRINSSGSNPRSDTFTGMKAGATYYYRITANHSTLAYGTIAAASAGAANR